MLSSSLNNLNSALQETVHVYEGWGERQVGLWVTYEIPKINKLSSFTD